MWQTSEDPTRRVDASRSRLVAAFDAWQKASGRAERGTNTHSCELFLKTIANQLDLSRDEAPVDLGLPKSRSTWSNWRNGRGKPTLKLRLDVCSAIMALTGVDSTSNGFLESSPINVTDMVTLGVVSVVPATVNQSAEEKEIHVDWIDFRVSSSKEVTLDLTKKSPSPAQSRYRVGSVRYVLKEASIFVQPGHLANPIATYLSDGMASENGKVNGLELTVDRDDFSRWRVQPTYPKEALQARVETLKLCSGDFSDVKVGVSVTKADVEPQISLDQSLELKRDEFYTTRERLIEQVLRNRLKDPGFRQRFVLSHAAAIHK